MEEEGRGGGGEVVGRIKTGKEMYNIIGTPAPLSQKLTAQSYVL